MHAIISVVGKDQVGILSFVSSKCFKNNANIVEVSQTIIDKYFTMFMMVNIDKLNVDFNDFVDELVNDGKKENLEIHVMHEDIFNLMHKI
jgi:ACT domain-containing protein